MVHRRVIPRGGRVANRVRRQNNRWRGGNPAGLPRTPNGVMIEGRGVIPDLDVQLTRAELLKGKDLQLDAAIQRIRGSSR